jgi:hypothetical protein
MTMFRAALAVAMVFIGGIAAFLGGIVLASALSTGSIILNYGTGSRATKEVVSRAADPARFNEFALMLGAAPLVLGGLAAWWGWRSLRGNRS